MTRRARLLSALLPLFAILPSLAANEIVASSRVVRVTVYADRAEVVRAGTTHVPQGASEVAIEGLPYTIEPDSLSVSAHGLAATLGAVELRDDARMPEAGPELAAAEKDVRAIEDEQLALAQEELADKEAMEYLRALRTPGAVASPLAATTSRPDAQAVQQTWSFLRARLDELGARMLARNVRSRDLRQKLEVARARVAAAQPKASVMLRRVIISLDAKAAGTLALELSYVVPGAAWHPSYRASLDPDQAQVALVTEGVITQETGEDWSDVELQLSTAAPARGVIAPELVASVVNVRNADFAARERGYIAEEVTVEARAPVPASPYSNYLQDKGAENVTVAKAELLRTAYNAIFVVPGRTTVPADNREHRVLLRSGSMPATLGYRVTATAQAAFVVARGTASKDWPMLAGSIRVFTGSAYIGELVHEETGPGAEIELPFGIDDRIAVTRVVTPEKRTNEGFGGRDEQVARSFKTRLVNRREQPVHVIVRDRVPVSKDERITVKRDDTTTPGAKDVADHPGLLEWEIDLKPAESREIVLAYTIRHPKNVAISETP